MGLKGEGVPLDVRFDGRTCYVGDCIVWTGGLDKDGYGHFPPYQGGRAHRYAYERHYGPITAGLVINHICRNHACVNPGHLETITHIENILHPASQAVTKINADKPHCPRGHAFKTYIRTNGRPRRYCPTCQKNNEKARKAVAA